jgi:hypothetical protein
MDMNIYSFVFALSLFFGSLQAWADACDSLGIGVEILPIQENHRGATDFSGDYDGDGIVDRLVFLRLASRPNFYEDVEVVKLFDAEPKFPENGSLAVGIILTGKGENTCRKYIIFHDEFFEINNMSMWSDTEKLPFDLIKKNDKLYHFWKKQAKGLKTDAFQLISDSLAEILIYWNGRTFIAQWNGFFDP